MEAENANMLVRQTKYVHLKTVHLTTAPQLDDEKGKIDPSKSLSTSNKRKSVLKKNISGLPAYDFNFNKQKTVEKPIEHQCVTQDSETLTSTTISVSSDVGISESDENTFVNDSDVLEKLSILESKVDKLTKDLKECKEKIVEKIVEKCADISVRLDNLDTILKKTESTLIITENELQIFPIDRVPALEKLEKDLEDKAYKKNVFAHLTRCIGSALPSKTACYKLAGIMFTKQLLTEYSWTGMSRSLEKKAFNRLTGILDIFYNVVFKSDNSFTYPGRDSFFRDCILKHSNTRLKLNKKVKAPAETQETKENEENQNPVTETQEEPQANEETINSVDSDKEELYEYFVVEEDGELTKTHQ
ncbi:unnamed protein product [Phaedon cochleariae]|uniref:DUF4806 domain-containing protein n=1 Tax=Phaedon cochleariae TaxID=80249 RepID=A0A9N9X0N3_PHACE|nr:unnamed protein product [Phaedon cochleariae]